MTAVEIDGYEYVGYLFIPTSGLKLPIMSEWDHTRLEIAPCRFTGSVFTGDLVIAALSQVPDTRVLQNNHIAVLIGIVIIINSFSMISCSI